jgi:cell division protein FtsQ
MARGVDSTSLFRAAVGVFAALVALIGVVLASEWLSRPDLVPLRAVRFEGEFRHVTQEQLAAAVEPALQGNFLQLDLDAVKARAESLPWVYQAEVRRRWPRDLLIRVAEQQLIARWNDYRDVGGRATPGAVAGDAAWVNHAMQVVRVTADDLPADAPRLEGPEGTQAIVYERWQEFGRVLAEAGLQIRTLALTPRRTWQIELANGPRLVLDRVQPERKLDRFVRVYGQGFGRAGNGARAVDLRYTNGFAVEWQRGVAAGSNGTTERTKSAAHTGAAQEEG